MGRHVRSACGDRRIQVAARHVGIDVCGVGGGTVDTTRHLLKPNEGHVRALNSAEKAPHALRAPDGGKAEYIGTEMEFGNLRAAMYWQARIDLADDEGELALPDDPEVIEELLAVQWDDGPRGHEPASARDRRRAFPTSR